jgi:hypothetical protein
VLEQLDRVPTSGGRLRLVEVRPGRFPEERDAVIAVGPHCPASVQVKYFAGRPSAHVPPWIEASIPADDERLATELVAALADLLPPGGRLMVVYRNDETERGLKRGVPPAATPLGHALLLAGCTWFKDWYFAEGGREGETKLQANKALTPDLGRNRSDVLRRELTAWLDRMPDHPDELERRARERALAALRCEPLAEPR